MTQETKKLYVSISAGEETYYFTKAEGLRLLSEEFDRIERDKTDTGNEYGYEWDWHWMTEEDYKDVSGSPDKPTFEPLPIPSSIEEEARKYADGNGFKIDPNDEMGESQASHKYIVDAFIAGSQLRPDTSRLRKALEELVELKGIKDTEGKTEDYERRQPIAWRNAIEALNTSGEDKQDDVEIWEEAWDEQSQHIDDDISSLEQVAGSDVMTKGDFMKLASTYHITKK